MSGDAPEVGLATLLDERDIHRALSHFARIADTKRFDDLGDVFAEDVTFDYGSGQDDRGIVALRGLLSRHLNRCGATPTLDRQRHRRRRR